MSLIKTGAVFSNVKNEWARALGVVSLGFLLAGRRKWAAAGALGALGLRLLPGQRDSFEGKTVLITGGSRGLGLALAEQFLRDGAHVALLARDRDELRRAKAHLGDGPSVMTVPCDITDSEELEAAFDEVEQKFGRIDVLVNNAGAMLVGPFESMVPAEFEMQLDIHLRASLHAIQLAIPRFRELGGGKIVNISSIGGMIPVPHMATYCVSKFALAGLSETLADELYQDGIEVTTVYPGLMRTGSPQQGVFKGDSEREFAWFATSAVMPLITISARRAARIIVRAAKRGRSRVVVSIPAKAAGVFQALFPETLHALSRTVVRFLPQDKSQSSRIGAASAVWWREQAWSKPLQGVLERTQSEFNQTVHR